jgi:hypothetical protein
MHVLTEVVEGWSGALPFVLNADDVPVDLTGMFVAIVLKDNAGIVLLDSSSGLTVTSASQGAVSYSPATSSGANPFTVSRTPIYIRFRVSDALGKAVYFPNADEDVIKVNRL